MKNQHSINMKINANEIDLNLLYRQPSARENRKYLDRFKAWEQSPVKTRGEKPELKTIIMDGVEFFIHILLQAITMAHRTGSTKVLRQTQALSLKFHIAKANDGILTLDEKEYQFVKESMEKADGWSNQLEAAAAIVMVEDAILDADIKEDKKK